MNTITIDIGNTRVKVAIFDENGGLVDNSKLDKFHGHTLATTDYPSGIYHYHITSVDPYINGAGFYGTPGTVSQ